MRYRSGIILGVLFLSAHLLADTIVMKTGRVLEGDEVERDEDSVTVKLEYGTMLVPLDKIQSVEKDSPEKLKEREAEAAEKKEFAEKMKAEGKVLYKGKWLDEAEKKAAEKKEAEEEKKRDAAREEKKKKAAEAAAKKKAEKEKREAEERKREQEQQRQWQQQQQRWNNNENYDPRAERFLDRHMRNGTRGGNDRYGNGDWSSYRNNSQRNNNNQRYNNNGWGGGNLRGQVDRVIQENLQRYTR